MGLGYEGSVPPSGWCRGRLWSPDHRQGGRPEGRSEHGADAVRAAHPVPGLLRLPPGRLPVEGVDQDRRDLHDQPAFLGGVLHTESILTATRALQ
jgi:hypothetical protein